MPCVSNVLRNTATTERSSICRSLSGVKMPCSPCRDRTRSGSRPHPRTIDSTVSQKPSSPLFQYTTAVRSFFVAPGFQNSASTPHGQTRLLRARAGRSERAGSRRQTPPHRVEEAPAEPRGSHRCRRAIRAIGTRISAGAPPEFPSERRHVPDLERLEELDAAFIEPPPHVRLV